MAWEHGLLSQTCVKFITDNATGCRGSINQTDSARCCVARLAAGWLLYLAGVNIIRILLPFDMNYTEVEQSNEFAL